MRKMRVLVVDDSRTLQLLLSRLLSADPELNVVGTAGSAAQAEAFLGDGRVDAVTLDVEMPDVGGLDYLRQLVRRGIPAVMVSTRVAKGDPVRAEAFRRGAAACFPKDKVVSSSAAFRDLVKAAARREVVLDRRDAAAAREAA